MRKRQESARARMPELALVSRLSNDAHITLEYAMERDKRARRPCAPTFLLCFLPLAGSARKSPIAWCKRRPSLALGRHLANPVEANTVAVAQWRFLNGDNS